MLTNLASSCSRTVACLRTFVKYNLNHYLRWLHTETYLLRYPRVIYYIDIDEIPETSYLHIFDYSLELQLRWTLRGLRFGCFVNINAINRILHAAHIHYLNKTDFKALSWWGRVKIITIWNYIKIGITLLTQLPW